METAICATENYLYEAAMLVLVKACINVYKNLLHQNRDPNLDGTKLRQHLSHHCYQSQNPKIKTAKFVKLINNL